MQVDHDGGQLALKQLRLFVLNEIYTYELMYRSKDIAFSQSHRHRPQEAILDRYDKFESGFRDEAI